MDIHRLPINSSKDSDQPFYELDISESKITVISDHDHGCDLDLSDETVQIDISVESMVAVDDADGLVQITQQTQSIRAGLAWINPDNNSIRVLKFQE